MQAKTPLANTPAPEKMADITNIIELIKQYSSSAATKANGIALIHILQGVTLEQWETLSSLTPCSSCFALPLNSTSLAALTEVQKKLTYKQTHDEFTGFITLPPFIQTVASECQRASRAGSDVTIAIIELDGYDVLTSQNDSSIINSIILRLSTLLGASVEAYDTVARIGAYKFAILFPAISCWAAQGQIKQIQLAFAKELFSNNNIQLNVTFSVGIASLSILDGAKTPNEIYTAAEDALNTAKVTGNNTIHITTTAKLAKDKSSIVHMQEKQFLFSCSGLE